MSDQRRRGLEPLEFVVTKELNDQYLFGEEDYHPRYHEESESGPPLVHPGLLLNMSNATRSPSFGKVLGSAAKSAGVGMAASIHASDEIEFVKPARVGQKLRIVWEDCPPYQKRGKTFTPGIALILDEDGELILRRKATGVVFLEGGKTV